MFQNQHIGLAGLKCRKVCEAGAAGLWGVSRADRLVEAAAPVIQGRPRVSPDNRVVYLLNQLTATVTTLSLDPASGALKELASVSAPPPDTKLVPGMPRGAVGTPGANEAPRNTDNDIWASDLHLTPNGRFLYAAERTSSTLGECRVDASSGTLTYVGSTATEKQPRGFAVDPSGRFVLVSGEKSDMISSYTIDAETGALKPIGRYATGKGANWVEIVAFE
jgi:6-phosphogluconolactonase